MAPQPPIDAIREAVRAEMAGVQTVAAQTAARAVAQAHLGVANGVFHAVALILAVRVLLLLGLAGGFVIALLALRDGSYQAAGVLVAYALLFMIPFVWLERMQKVERPKI